VLFEKLLYCNGETPATTATQEEAARKPLNVALVAAAAAEKATGSLEAERDRQSACMIEF